MANDSDGLDTSGTTVSEPLYSGKWWLVRHADDTSGPHTKIDWFPPYEHEVTVRAAEVEAPK